MSVVLLFFYITLRQHHKGMALLKGNTMLSWPQHGLFTFFKVKLGILGLKISEAVVTLTLSLGMRSSFWGAKSPWTHGRPN